MVFSGVPRPSHFPIGPMPGHLITTAAALRVGQFFRDRLNDHFDLGLILRSSVKKFSHLGLLELKDIWRDRVLQFRGINFLQLPNDTFSATSSSWSAFFTGEESRKNSGGEGTPYSETSRRHSFNGRQMTNILLAINVLVYIAQIATQGKLMLWGAKINSLIDRGQLWRLATSSLLHANIGHLMINCYSLNSVGPTVESISGPRRYLAVYFASAITSSAMSYWFCKAPAVGASGAIFGLVGSVAVYVARHKRLTGGGKEHLQHIAGVILLNMVIGLLSKGIDNWGHVGGLVGGAAISWVVGPAWKYENAMGRKIFVDRAPIFYLTNTKGPHRFGN